MVVRVSNTGLREACHVVHIYGEPGDAPSNVLLEFAP